MRIAVVILSLFHFACQNGTDRTKMAQASSGGKRFFSDSSFWNQPLPVNVEIDTASERWIGILSQEPSGAFFGINTDQYTIPVFEADRTTPLYNIGHRPVSEHFRKVHGYRNQWFTENSFYGHGPGFGQGFPIPSKATMDPAEDAHLAVVDWEKNLIWDVWGMEIIDGKFCSFTGMRYEARGSGVFDPAWFHVKDGESIHFYGPSRAAGVPAVAGLIMYHEVQAGAINHKLAVATRFNAYKEFVYPAVWTDGVLPGGIPEGAVIQLDPELDLSQFDLTPEEKLVAQAAQKYGMVVVDQGGANAIYAQGLYANSAVSWKDKLRGWEAGMISIPVHHYRVIKCSDRIQKGGLNSEELNNHYFNVIH